jgi:hypothetical protein
MTILRDCWLAFILIALAAIALVLSLFKLHDGHIIFAWDPASTGTILAELLIAFVIYPRNWTDSVQ